jgi:hypothetical protein
MGVGGDFEIDVEIVSLDEDPCHTTQRQKEEP